MAVDEQRIKIFVQKQPLRGAIAGAVRRAGFRITWVNEHRPGLWGFYLRPNRHLQDVLGTNREILLWTTDFPDFQARAVSQATEIVEREQPRLCDDIVLLVSADPNTRERLSEVATGSHINFVGFSTSEFEEFEPRGQQLLLASIQQQLFTKDLYLLTGAVTQRKSFFGRDSLLKEMRTTLSTGTAHIALFGLRKSGKTSVLYRLVDEVRRTKQLVHAHLDIQRLDAISPTSEYFLWSIGEQLHLGHASVRATSGLRLFGQYATYSDVPAGSSIPELFDHDFRILLSKTNKRFLLMIDEVELMSPQAPGSTWGDAYVRSWRLLRGLDQTNPGRFRFLVAGTNPKCVELNQLGGKENPTYNYFSKRYLDPLSREESRELVTSIGRRLGLLWSEAASCKVAELTGGHPFLLRSFCSQLHRQLSPRTETMQVGEETVLANIGAATLELSSTLSQMVEVLESEYSNEYFLLQHLASGRMGEYNEMADAFPEDVAHLNGYGLVESQNSINSIRIELLQAWLQRRERIRESGGRTESAGAELSRGAQLDGYVIETIVGKPGGFGSVYKARSPSGEFVALKILAAGSLSKLQREVDALQAIKHPAVVQVLDSGRFSTGEVYLAMEFIEGSTLRERCTRATRLPQTSAICFLRRLLEALSEIHPNEALMSELRKKEELSTADFRDLEIARHGYVHRDIKPENIMIDSKGQPVLVDFGISIRASSPVKTVSATPGYLPPDGIGGVWTPDTDLYQLGLTMLQASTGVQFTGDNTDDLRALAVSELDPALAQALVRLTEPSRSARYSSAQTALRDVV